MDPALNPGLGNADPLQGVKGTPDMPVCVPLHEGEAHLLNS